MATIQELSAKLEGAKRTLSQHQRDLQVATDQATLYQERMSNCILNVAAAAEDVRALNQQLREALMEDTNADV